MPDINTQQQAPASPASGMPAPVIHTMPDKFIGAAPGKPPVIREVVEKRVVAAPLPPPPTPPAPAKKGKRRLVLIVAGGVAVLAGAATTAYILLVAPSAVPPANVNSAPPANLNLNANVPPPPAPQCGNSIVENGEQCDIGSQNGEKGSGCAADCQLEKKAPVVPNTGTDTDADGLTDVEENGIYRTSILNIDTDGDTFNDGNEVAHLYDPLAKAPASLADSSAMRTVNNSSQGYSALVPASWKVRGEDSEQFAAVSDVSPDSFTVTASEKPKDQPLVEWYLAMSPGSEAADVERIKTLGGYDALRSPDRMTVYVDAGNGKVFTLSYGYDGQEKIEFRTTFEAFIASFKAL